MLQGRSETVEIWLKLVIPLGDTESGSKFDVPIFEIKKFRDTLYSRGDLIERNVTRTAPRVHGRISSGEKKEKEKRKAASWRKLAWDSRRESPGA